MTDITRESGRMNPGRADITVGLRVPHELPGGAAGLRDFAARAEATGIDRLFIGDHVTFQGGHGFDGLLNATAVAVASRRLTVQTAVYLLPLRHPVPVARQVASLAALAPGRLVFGVGLGGEDPAELRACGIDPATRGRRMDEALAVLRPLLAGAEVTMRGAFFRLDQVRIQPAPAAAGADRDRRAVRRSAAPGGPARRRLARPVGLPRPLRRRGRADREVRRGRGPPVPGWQHGMHVWCGIGASAAAARSRLAAVMEAFYATRSANLNGIARTGRRPRSRTACGRTWTRAAGRST